MSVLSMLLAFVMVPAAKQPSGGDDRVLELERENETLKTQIGALQGGHAADQIVIATLREIGRQAERRIGHQRDQLQYWQNTARSLMGDGPHHMLMEHLNQQALAQAYQQSQQSQQNLQGLAQGSYFGDCTCIPDRAAALGVPARQRMIGIGALGSATRIA